MSSSETHNPKKRIICHDDDDSGHTKKKLHVLIVNETHFTDIWPELIQKILSFDKRTQHYITTKLWMTGNKLMQQQIDCSTIEYTMWACSPRIIPKPMKVKSCKYKKCKCVHFGSAVKLNHVNVLLIGSNERNIAHHLHYGGKTSSVNWNLTFTSSDALSLPRSLTRLQIGTDKHSAGLQQKGDWILRSSALKHIACSENLLFLKIICVMSKADSHLQIFEKFSQLTTLHMDIRSFSVNSRMLRFPQTITALHCNALSIISQAAASSLPRGLTALSIFDWNSNIPMLPHLQSVTYLELAAFVYEDTTATNVIGSNNNNNLLLPPNISVFLVSALFETKPHNAMFNLPSTLTDLEIGDDADGVGDNIIYPASLQHIRHQVIYDVNLKFNAPFLSSANTLQTLDLFVLGVFKTDVHCLPLLRALKHLQICVTIESSCTTISSEDNSSAVSTFKLFKLPPSLHVFILQFNTPSALSSIIKIIPHDDSTVYEQLYYVNIKFLGHLTVHKICVDLPATLFPSLRYGSFQWGSKSVSDRQFNFNNQIINLRTSATGRSDYYAEIENGSCIQGEVGIIPTTVPEPIFSPSPWEMKMYY